MYMYICISIFIEYTYLSKGPGRATHYVGNWPSRAECKGPAQPLRQSWLAMQDLPQRSGPMQTPRGNMTTGPNTAGMPPTWHDT